MHWLISLPDNGCKPMTAIMTRDELFTRIKTAPSTAERNKLLGEAQKLLADDAVLAWLYQPQWITVAKKNVQGLWKDMPVFVNDLSSMYWA